MAAWPAKWLRKSTAEGRPYDLIFMDMQMPEMNGYDATRWLRQHGWRGPIVALTAYAMVGDREKCLAAGCDDYLSKPMTPQGLRDTLARYISAPDCEAAARDANPPARPKPQRRLKHIELRTRTSTNSGRDSSLCCRRGHMTWKKLGGPAPHGTRPRGPSTQRHIRRLWTSQHCPGRRCR